MNKKDFYLKVIDICVGFGTETGVYFIEPLWEEILEEQIKDKPDGVTNDKIFKVLDLAVKKANALHSPLFLLASAIYEASKENKASE